MSAASPADLAATNPVVAHRVSLLRRICSFPVLLCALLALLAVLTVRDRFNDPDLWWHLKTGQIIWTTHTIPMVDQFSFTAFHHALVPQEWLSQVLIYGAYRLLGGYTGLMLWLCGFSALLLIAGYALCNLYSGNPKTAFIGALTIWYFSTVGLAVRPQLIGYILLVFELLIVYLGRTRSLRWFFALPPLFALWVNCHASFFLGLVVLAVILVCGGFTFAAGPFVTKRWSVRALRAGIGAFVFSCAAVFLNPDGYHTVFYPLNTMFHQPVNLANTQEWMPLTVHDQRGVALPLLLAFVVVILMVRRVEVLYLDEAVLLALGGWMALNHQRMAFVFGILAAPILARLIAHLWESYDPQRDLPVANAVLTVAVLAAAVFFFPSRKSIIAQIDRANPVGAVAYIQAHHLSGNMLNDYYDGGYLVWSLPKHPVFIDGRADLYEWAGVLRQYGRWATLQANPDDLLRKYNIGFCLIDQGAPMSYVMPLLPGWKRVYSDSYAEIFVRTASTTPSPQ